MDIRFTRGLPLARGHFPPQTPLGSPVVTEVGISGRDFIGLKPQFKIQTGDKVEPGQVLLQDRHQPEIAIKSPVSGRVGEVTRRHPETRAFFLSMEVEGVEQYSIRTPVDWRDKAVVREILLRSGLWPALRQRPFGTVADPDQSPAAILVCGTAADDYAPDPKPIIEAFQHDFDTGVEALRFLTDGSVLVSRSADSNNSEDAVTFDGPFPAGLAGAQIHALQLAQHDQPVWWLNYQETIAIGHLLNCGQVMAERTISVAGPGTETPLLVKAPPCASIADLTEEPFSGTHIEVRSGPVYAGRRDQYLGRHDLQVSVLQTKDVGSSWLARVGKGLAAYGSEPKPIIPIAAHEESFPFRMPVVPLLRALAVGDLETATRMGCLDLIEEDVAVLSHVCPSGNNYQALLRGALDEIRRGA